MSTYQNLLKRPGSDFLSMPGASKVGIYQGTEQAAMGVSKIGNRGRKLSVSEMMANNARGGPDMSLVTDAASGQRLTSADAAERMPAGGYQVGGFGGGRGRGGHGGGYSGGGYAGGMQPRSRISSAGVAGGTPTSARGRAELAMQQNPTLSALDAIEGAQKPAWQASSENWAETAFDPNPRYGSMGRPGTRGKGDLSVGIETAAEDAASWAGKMARPKGYAHGTDDTGKKPRVALFGDGGQTEVAVMPPHSKVIPSIQKAVEMLGPEAFDELVGGGLGAGSAPPAKAPYMDAPLAPSRNAFKATALDRYDDLTNRLAALRAEGLASGRARVLENTARQQAEMAEGDALRASGTPVPAADGGGMQYQTKYGTAIVGSNRPKSFTVENWEGGQTASADLKEVDRESRADAAERTVRGLGVRGYRGYGTPQQVVPEQPAAIDEIAPSETKGVITGAPRPARWDTGRGFEPTSKPQDYNPALVAREVAKRKAASMERAETAPPRPVTGSRATRLIEGAEDEAFDLAKRGAKGVVDAWDYLFTEGGTAEERRDVQKELNEAGARLEKKGFKIERDKDGNVISLGLKKKDAK